MFSGLYLILQSYNFLLDLVFILCILFVYLCMYALIVCLSLYAFIVYQSMYNLLVALREPLIGT